MSSTIFYVPLEPLAERYTVQLSAPKIGWIERRWNEEGVPYVRVEGKGLRNEIKEGVVLDAVGRGYWACSQIMSLLQLIDQGCVKDDDLIYFDDFWHPGIESLPYAFHILGCRPKMFAMLHAQSVDPFDFTYPMRRWMRSFEHGIGKILEGIFVTSTCLKDLVVQAGISTEEKVHITGLPFNSEEVKTHWPPSLPEKKKQVIFSSRWDMEKRPDIFLKIVDKTIRRRPDIRFVVTTSATRLRSNQPSSLDLLYRSIERFPQNLELREDQTKEQYYQNLLESRIQINTADQDFVSWTLLEAATCGCTPVYPYYLSFPEALEFRHEYMYPKNDVDGAVDRIIHWIDHVPAIDEYTWIYERFDYSWKRMLQAMKGEDYERLYNDGLCSSSV